MPYVAPEVVQRVKQIDLLTYLKNYEPYHEPDCRCVQTVLGCAGTAGNSGFYRL